MELYSLDDANYLINYYTPLMKGKVVEKSTQGVIKWLEKEPYNGGLFRVNAIANGGLSNEQQLKRSIGFVIKELGLDPPELVLSHRDQTQ